MNIVQMIIIAILIAIYPQRGTFISAVKLKAGLKGIEFEMRAKEKNGPSSKNDRSSSNRNN